MLIRSCLSLALVMCLKCTVLVQETGTGRKTQLLVALQNCMRHRILGKTPEGKVQIEVTCKSIMQKINSGE